MNYDKVKEGLAADGTANINLLPTSTQSSDKYSVRLQDNNGNYYLHNDSYEVIQTTANNKALGNDLSGTASELDLYIQLESSNPWSYEYANGYVANDKYDFVSVVLHELGHGLGFISGIDAQSSQFTSLPSTLDLFRYSSNSASQGAIDFTVGGTKYFSTDGGQTQAGQFSTGENNSLGGDGDQASHWKYTTQQNTNDENDDQPYLLDIMNPKIQMGEIRAISQKDLKALDYIGWDVVNYSGDNDEEESNLSSLELLAAIKASYIWLTGNKIEDRSSDIQNMIIQTGIYDISYNGGGSSSGGFNFWQDTNSITTGNSTESNQEYNSLSGQEYQAATTPEPNLLAGVGIMSLFGWLHRRNHR